MERVLLDTDIFSELLKQKHKKVLETAKSYHHFFGCYTISTVTILEIVKGFHKIQREDSIQRLLSMLKNIELVTLTAASAEIAGRMYADLECGDQTIGRADPIIAAIAVERNLVLCTGNEKHYSRIQQLGYPLLLTNWKM
ncbi:MAG TPA: PIN domain-containing protein [Methylomicrobium sp.]|nr:PIN domain-containing protein [Methylomicrobium sp.]